MTAHEILILTISLFAGAVFGAAFFGGLWWTVLKAIRARNMVFIFLTSFVVRMTFVLTAFYFVGRAHPDRLAACLLGFIVGRILVVRAARPALTKNQA
jgi:F1F0 ATPase subunit 2